MKPLERYLNVATRGLSGETRERVKRELRGNLELRVRELQGAGHHEAQATIQALEEIGAPQDMARAMARVYVLPTLGKVAVLGALTTGIVLSSWLSRDEGVAYLTASENIPKASIFLGHIWLNLENLRKKVGLENNMVLNPGETLDPTNLPGCSVSISSICTYKNQVYVLETYLSRLIWNSSKPVKFHRLDEAVLEFGGNSIKMGNDKYGLKNILLGVMYGNSLKLVPRPDFYGLDQMPDSTKYAKIEARGKADSTYVLVRWRSEGTRKGSLLFDFAQANAKGKLEFTGENQSRIFAKTPAEWAANLKTTALMVRLTGRLDRDVFDFKAVLTPPPYRSSNVYP